MNTDNSKNDELEEEIPLLESRPPSERDKFYLSWGLELVKNQFNLANELLKQQISVCITLLGVSVIFDKLFDNNAKLKFIVVLIFFLSLISAFIGLFPFNKKLIWLDSPTDIEYAQTDALKFKRCCYLASGVFIMTGILLVVIKLLLIAFFS